MEQNDEAGAQPAHHVPGGLRTRQCREGDHGQCSGEVPLGRCGCTCHAQPGPLEGEVAAMRAGYDRARAAELDGPALVRAELVNRFDAALEHEVASGRFDAGAAATARELLGRCEAASRGAQPSQAAPPPALDVLVFGCIGEAGHYLHTRCTRTARLDTTPWGMQLDGGLLTDDYQRADSRPTGEWVEHHRDGWTAVSFWDRSGDERPGSNTTLLAHADVPGPQLIAAARGQWPELFARPGFPPLVATGKGGAR